MSLREEREILSTIHDVAMSGATIDRGGIVSATSTEKIGAYAIEPSGAVPIGLLLIDVEDRAITNDGLTTHHYNANKPSVTGSGEVVSLVTRGKVVTDKIDPAATVVYGASAYVSGSGLIGDTASGGRARVGKWLSEADDDGFAKLSVELA